MTRLSLIRHGEPSLDAVGTHYGQLDVGLSEAGHAQSLAAAARFADLTFDAVWSSDLRRARELAILLAEPRGLEVREDRALRERHVGVFQGLTYEAAEATYPAEAARLREEGESYRLPAGENMSDLAARVLPSIESILRAHAGGHVAIAAHGGPIRVVVGHALGIPLENLRRLKIGYCSVSEIEFRKDGFARVLRVNA